MKENRIVYIQNLKQSYHQEEKHKLIVINRSKYPNLTYSGSPDYQPIELLPQTSYYSVINVRTGDVVVEHSDYTKLSHDLETNYFFFDMSSLEVGQFYKFRIHVYYENTEYVYDDLPMFKIKT